MKTVVRAFVFNQDGAVLLAQHRPNTPWVLPGGHVESGESIHDAMIRELQEEFSLEARFFEVDHGEMLHHKGKKLKHHPLPIAIYDLEYKNEKGEDRSRTEYVFLMETDDIVSNIQKEEILHYRWYSAEEILTMSPNIDTWDFVIEMLEKVLSDEDE